MSYRFVKINDERYLNIDRIDGIFYDKQNGKNPLKIFVGGSDDPWTISETPEEFLNKIKDPLNSFTQEEKDMLSAALITKCYDGHYYKNKKIYDSIMRKIKTSPLWID